MASETELERLVVRLVGDGSSYLSMLKAAQVETGKTGMAVAAVDTEIKAVNASLMGFASGAVSQFTAVIGVVGLLGTALKSLRLAGQEEKNIIDFGVMLKSADKGQKLVQDIQKFAAATPLNQGDIQTAAKTLLQFGTTGRDVMPILKQLGDVTGGDAQRFNQMALAFGQMSSTGRLMGQDLLQMINAGFNPLQEISRTTGKDMGFLKDEMEKGRITVQMVRDAFVSATAAGGQFDGLMQKQAQSLTGLFSTMIDDTEAAQREFGKMLVSTLGLKDALQGVSTVAQSIADGFKSVSEGTQETIGLSARATVEVAALSLAMWGLSRSVTAVGTAGKGLAALQMNPFVWLGEAAVGAALLTSALRNINGEMDRLDASLKSSDKFWEKNANAYKATSSKNLDAAGSMPDVKAEVARLEEELERSKSTKNRLTDDPEYNRLTRTMGSLWLSIGGRAPEFERKKQDIAGVTKEIEALENALEAARNKQAEFTDPEIARKWADRFKAEADKAKKALVDLRAKARASIVDMQDDLAGDRAQVDALNRGDIYWNAQLEKLGKLLPAGSRLLQFMREYAKETKMMEEAREVREGLKTPEQKLAKEQDRLFGLLTSNIAKNRLTWEEYAKAVSKARDELLGVTAAITDAVDATSNQSRVMMYQQELLLRGPTRSGLLPAWVQQGPMPREDVRGLGRGGGDDVSAGRGGPWDPNDPASRGGGMAQFQGQWPPSDARGGEAAKALNTLSPILDALVKVLTDSVTRGVSIGFVNAGGL